MTRARAVPGKSRARWAGALAMGIGALVLAGWALDIAALKSIRPDWVSMKPNTALAFVLTGIALLFSSRPPLTSGPQPSRLVSRFARVCGWLAGLIGLLTLCEYVFGWKIGIDQWLFPEPPGTAGTSYPGRMAPDTALCFVLVAAAGGMTSGSRAIRWAWRAAGILGLLLTTLALATLLSYVTPDMSPHGWWGLTRMAIVTAALFAILGAVLVSDAWRETVGATLARFSSQLWRTVGCVGALAVAFFLYAWSETQIGRAYDRRHRSFVLADELRLSSDDLTRMACTYVVTGDPVYKQQYRDILDIRDGKKTRPEDYSRPYWDFVLPGRPAPRPASQQAIPLLKLMRQAGLTPEELRKLAEAKANSDALTRLEFEAMKLVESAGPSAEANRDKARRMMHDANYHQAKAAILGPIHDCVALLDQRTLAAVRGAEKSSTIYRCIFGASGLGLVFMLWRTYVALGDILGGSVDEVYAHITRLGSGDFRSPIPVKAGLSNSVLGWLSETQARLTANDHQRRRVEAALRESELRFRQLAESLPQMVWSCQPDGPCDYLSPKWAAFTGRPETEQLGFGWLNQVHPDDRDGLTRAWNTAVAAGGVFEVEFRIRRHDGVYRWFDTRAVPWRDESGKLAKWFGSNTDITERKRAQEALRESEQKFRTIFDRAKDGMFIVDLTTRKYVQCNAMCSQLLGFDEEEFVNLDLADIHPAEDMPFIFEQIEKLAKGGKAVEDEIRFKPRNGTVFYADVSPALITLAGRKSVLLAFRDVTERKRAEEALARRAEELAQFNTAAVGRELRMIGLKQQINDLARQLGQPPPYALELLEGAVQTNAPRIEKGIIENPEPALETCRSRVNQAQTPKKSETPNVVSSSSEIGSPNSQTTNPGSAA